MTVDFIHKCDKYSKPGKMVSLLSFYWQLYPNCTSTTHNNKSMCINPYDMKSTQPYNLFNNIIFMCGVNIFFYNKLCSVLYLQFCVSLMWLSLPYSGESSCLLSELSVHHLVIFTMLLSLQDVIAIKKKKTTSEQKDVCLFPRTCLRPHISIE